MYTVPGQSGKRFVITGANTGTGKEATRRIAAAGGAVIMAVRTPSKGEAAKAEILRDHPGAALEVRQFDLADLSGVRAFAESLLADGTPIDVLVNSAGVLMPPPTRMLTADGFELQFGTNFLGPFALTVLLLPRILESATPRVTRSPGCRRVLADKGSQEQPRTRKRVGRPDGISLRLPRFVERLTT